MSIEDFNRILRIENITVYKERGEIKCLHEQCPCCKGTGIKNDGTMCVHMISCPCPKCRPR